MINYYGNSFIHVVSFILSVLVFVLVQFIIPRIGLLDFDTSIIFFQNRNIIQVEMIDDDVVELEQEINEISVTQNPKEEAKQKWSLQIPAIFLEAEIAEGTSQDIMNVWIGHFEETSKSLGNIGLAAHNRGYAVNYFEKLRQLKEGDEIFYQYQDFNKTYVVEKHVIIRDTDWRLLQPTKKNKITLITCIENEPEYRRCVQAVEKNE